MPPENRLNNLSTPAGVAEKPPKQSYLDKRDVPI